MGDFNVDLNSAAPSSYTSEYLHMLQSNAFFNDISKPTRVLKNSQTIIDHILSYNSESIITQQVLLFKIFDHFPLICTLRIPNLKAQNLKLLLSVILKLSIF